MYFWIITPLWQRIRISYSVNNILYNGCYKVAFLEHWRYMDKTHREKKVKRKMKNIMIGWRVIEEVRWIYDTHRRTSGRWTHKMKTSTVHRSLEKRTTAWERRFKHGAEGPDHREPLSLHSLNSCAIDHEREAGLRSREIPCYAGGLDFGPCFFAWLGDELRHGGYARESPRASSTELTGGSRFSWAWLYLTGTQT